MTTYQEKITFGEMRASDVRDVLIYCRIITAAIRRRSTPTAGRIMSRLSDIEPGFVYSACCKRGAEVRPKFSQARMGAG